MRTMKHFALATMAAAALALAGCGGGGSGGTASAPTPQPMPVDTSGVAAGAMAQAGSYMIAAGQSATHGDVTYSCPAGGGGLCGRRYGGRHDDVDRRYGHGDELRGL